MTPWRVLTALCVGLGGAALIWYGAALDRCLGFGNISNNYLPAPALFLSFVLCLVANPLLKRLAPAMVFDEKQRVLIFVILMAATVLPTTPLLGDLPAMLASACWEASSKQEISEMYRKLSFPAAMFPEALRFGQETPASVSYLQGLSPTESIPWACWIRPCLVWGFFLVSAWLFMMGIGMLVYPQWRHNERHAFPLADIYGVQLELPDESRRRFWIAAAAVLSLHLFNGLHHYFPAKVPEFPLWWSLRPAFTGSPLLAQIPPWIVDGRLFFSLIAMGFLAPRRLGFSIWVFTVVYGLHQAIVKVYFPPYAWEAADDHRAGAMFAMMVFVLWVGRRHWAEVFGSLFKPSATPEASSDRLGVLFWLVGTAGLVGWLIYARVPPAGALFLVFIGFMICVVMSRIVAETGVPFLRLYGAEPLVVLGSFPKPWMTHATVYFAGILGVFFHQGSRVNLTVLTTHCLAVGEDRAPRWRRVTPLAMLAVLLIGLGAYGAMTLNMGYRGCPALSASRPFGYQKPDTLQRAHDAVTRLDRGGLQVGAIRMRPERVLFGAALAGGLEWACLSIPSWPLHPIGLITVRTYYANVAWPSMFVGWLLQMLALRYGGARLHRRLRAVCWGMVIGEVLAVVFWRIVAYVLAACGVPCIDVPIVP